MTYVLTDLVWLFFVYSFAGWCVEVCFAAFNRRKFVNRGFVNSPYCTIYGFSAVVFAVFLPELTDNLFFLFLGGLLLASVVEYTTGMLMEKIFRRKLWDYSEIKYNLGGYVCLRYSLLWGLLAVATMRFLNPVLCGLLRGIPRPVTLVAQWTAAGLLAADFITTSMAVLGMKVTAKRLSQLSEGMQQTSRLLENRLTAGVQKRMQRSFPSINPEDIAADIRAKSERAKAGHAVFAEGCCFYKLTALFFIGAVPYSSLISFCAYALCLFASRRPCSPTRKTAHRAIPRKIIHSFIFYYYHPGRPSFYTSACFLRSW